MKKSSIDNRDIIFFTWKTLGNSLQFYRLKYVGFIY